MRICRNDITDHIRKHFGANPLRSPESRIQPLCLMDINKSKANYLGEFQFLVKGGFAHDLPIKESKVAGVSDEKTAKMDIGFGFKFLEGYLKALGLDPASIAASLNNSKKMSFSFSNVRRRFFDPLQFGQILSSNDIIANTDNFMIANIMKNEGKLALITDVIVSNNFSLSTFTENDAAADLSVPAIQQAVSGGKLDVKFNRKSKNEIEFEADHDLTFAFSALEITIDPATGKFGRGDWLKNLRSATGEKKALEDLKTEEQHLLDKVKLDENEEFPLLIEF